MAPGMKAATSRNRTGSTSKPSNACWHARAQRCFHEASSAAVRGYRRSSSAGSGGSARRRFSIARESGAVSAIEGFDDRADPSIQRTHRIVSPGLFAAALGGALEHRCPQSVDIAELVFHRAPGGAALLGDLVGRHRCRISGGEHSEGGLKHALAGCQTATIRPPPGGHHFAHPDDASACGNFS